MTDLHHSTFAYLNPTADQKEAMSAVREAAALYANALEEHVPNGPDKTYMLRKLREVAMWANVAITREASGAPRVDYPAGHPVKGDLGSVPL